MNLSDHFTLDEAILSREAVIHGIDNTPTEAMLDTLRYTAGMAEEVRMLLGVPMRVTSWYRSPALNKLVKGAKNSAHMLGLAIDFTAPRFGPPAEVVSKIAASSINFDQCIVEYDKWVHIAFPIPGLEGRRQTFRIG